jgi:hypothetical protein
MFIQPVSSLSGFYALVLLGWACPGAPRGSPGGLQALQLTRQGVHFPQTVQAHPRGPKY